MGQAPATGRISLRTVPRNFPGRSGTKDDLVYLCSPETAIASALTGVITDPRDLDVPYPQFRHPAKNYVNTEMLEAPGEHGRDVPLEKGPNIASLPEFDPLPATLAGPVLLKVGDDISTDEIMPAGSRVLPYRSNIPAMADFVFDAVDATYPHRAAQARREGGHFVVGGDNYGQGSSREHAAIAPRYLGLRVVIAKTFARIHWQNLVNFAILPLTFTDPTDYDRVEQGDVLELPEVREGLAVGVELEVLNRTRDERYRLGHRLSARQIEIVCAGSLLTLIGTSAH
jgi:aconitate hydratase